jgi:hypothetical protein
MRKNNKLLLSVMLIVALSAFFGYKYFKVPATAKSEARTEKADTAKRTPPANPSVKLILNDDDTVKGDISVRSSTTSIVYEKGKPAKKQTVVKGKIASGKDTVIQHQRNFELAKSMGNPQFRNEDPKKILKMIADNMHAEIQFDQELPLKVFTGSLYEFLNLGIFPGTAVGSQDDITVETLSDLPKY